MSPQRITSPANPLIKRARALKNRKNRLSQGSTLVEGIAPVIEAVDHAEIEVLLWAPDLLTSERGKSLVERAESSGADIAELSSEAFAAIADRENPSGLAALVAIPSRTLDDLEVDSQSLFVALENVASPGNLGSIVRTADAVGVQVIVAGESTDPWHPACVKASMGTVFSTPPATVARLDEVLDWCWSKNVAVVTTSARADTELWDAKVNMPAALVLGSERRGLSPEALASGDVQLRIPMEGAASSLNLAVAAGILLFEIQRRT